jgi:hypothetical protein
MGVVWAQAFMAGSTSAIAAADTKPRESKLSFLVIILEFHASSAGSFDEISLRPKAKRQRRQPVGATLPTVKDDSNRHWAHSS